MPSVPTVYELTIRGENVGIFTSVNEAQHTVGSHLQWKEGDQEDDGHRFWEAYNPELDENEDAWIYEYVVNRRYRVEREP